MSDEEIRKLQQALVEQLKAAGNLTAPGVEQAFLTVPRHLFLPEEPLAVAYSDRAIVVRRGADGEWTSASSQPAIMAIMLEQLDLKPGHRVLEIGTGSGFNAALIASIVGPGGKVVTIDIQPDLIAHARQCLDRAGYGWVETRLGDGGHGDPDGAPYDRIILTVASHTITQAWREQLAPGGRLVLPLSIVGGVQHCVAFEKRDQELVSVSICNCGFMVLQGAFAPPQPVRTQIGPDPRLCLFSEDGKALPAGADTIAAWLAQPGADRATGVTVVMLEMWRSFFAWMGVQAVRQNEEAGLAGSLHARGDLADAPDIPSLFGMAGEWKSMVCAVWLEPDGMAALIRPPGQRPPLADINHPQDDQPFELYVREFGPGGRAPERLLQQVQEWHRAGRPASSGWHIRAIPAETDYHPSEGEFLINKPWTQLIVRYPQTQQDQK